MITYKDTERKTSTPKRHIKIEAVSVEGDQLCDEEGNIAQRLADALPEGVEEFTIKVSINLPDDEE